MTEVEPAYPVVFEELTVSEKDLRAGLSARDPLFGAKIPATKPVLERYTRWVQEILTEHQIDEGVRRIAELIG